MVVVDTTDIDIAIVRAEPLSTLAP